MFVVLLSFAYQPILLGDDSGAAPGFVADDFAALAELSGELGTTRTAGLAARLSALRGVDRVGGHTLTALSLAWSSTLHSDGGAWTNAHAVNLRLENLAAALLAAVGLAFFVRRLLLPWTGREQARAAAIAAACTLALHPLLVGAVATVAGRGDLLALAFGSLSGALFLRGRQEQSYPWCAGAGALAVLAGMSSDLALALPIALFGAELFSARRYRPLHVRLRTAATTAGVFFACVAVDWLLGAIERGYVSLPPSLAALPTMHGADGLVRRLATGVEKLGALVLPVNAATVGALGFALAGAMVLLALQPAFVAARSAPRLWGAFLACWAAAVVISLLHFTELRVYGGDLTFARILCGGAAAMSVGFALSATAVSGLRRVLIPLVLASGSAILAQGSARGWAAAAREVASLRTTLDSARELYGRDASVLVLDPPDIVLGVRALVPDLSALIDPAFTAPDRRELAAQRASGAAVPALRGLSQAAFCMLARDASFTNMRSAGVIALLPPGALDGNASESTKTQREAARLPPPKPTTGTRKWYSEGAAAPVDLEALTARCVWARVAPDTDRSQLPVLGWKAKAAIAPEGTQTGAWIDGAGEPTAVFDVSSSLAWLFGERIRLLYPVEHWSKILESEVLDESPRVKATVASRVDGDDWLFEQPGDVPIEAATPWPSASGTWRLALLGLARCEYAEIEVERHGTGDLRAPRAESTVREWLARGGEAIAWSLEYRVQGVTIARLDGSR